MEDEQILMILEFVIYFVIAIKIIFVFFSVLYRISVKKDSNRKNQLLFWKNKVEFVYVFMMSLILIYIFYPWNENTRFLTPKMCHLIFLYGIISIFTAQWSDLD